MGLKLTDEDGFPPVWVTVLVYGCIGTAGVLLALWLGMGAEMQVETVPHGECPDVAQHEHEVNDEVD